MNKITVQLDSCAYDIFIENSILNKVGALLKERFNTKKFVIITDDTVYRLHLDKLISSLSDSGYYTDIITVPSGEQSKSMEQLEQVYDQLAALNITRDCLILAFGGGVIGDLAGFAASTYLRGIPYIQIPTTLLAQVDSSVGGKVAVNLSSGKNLVGSFYHPKLVFIDPTLLSTLPQIQISNGMAEIIKYGAIKDRTLFDLLLDIPDNDALFQQLEQIIIKCVSIKKEIVQRDEKDNGERMLLNFGHTLGHVIENYFNYRTYTHGEAVAIGMCIITKFTQQMKLTESSAYSMLVQACKKYQLPFEMPVMDVSKIQDIAMLDKKFNNSYANLIILSDIGNAYIHKVSSQDTLSYFGL